MQNEIAIKVENLTKIYHLYDKPQDRLKEALNPFKKSYHHDFYAMNDVSFEIKKGETVGIVGKNGAGKSTLLKMITGVLTPTSGSIEIHGKIASILELGAGFNPEMTGLENIYLYGTLTGFSKEEIDQKKDAIAAFADIGDFLYQPIKGYSSGMLARLAFASAINIDADILIVDEALSVGDMVFQAKCMAKMTSLMEQGVTVLFVSHDTHSVKTLCNQAVFIDKGKLIDFGDVGSVTDQYIEMNHCAVAENLKELEMQETLETDSSMDDFTNDAIPVVVALTDAIVPTDIMQRYGDERAQILDVAILDETFARTKELISKKRYYLQMSILFKESLPTFVIAGALSSLDGVQQLAWISTQDDVMLPSVQESEIYVSTIAIDIPIKAGVYNIGVAIELPTIHNQQHQFLDVIKNVETVNINFKNPEKQFYSTFYTQGQYYLQKINA